MKLTLVALAAAILAGVGADTCAACSCVRGDPRDMVQRADAAFVGVLLKKELKNPPLRTSADPAIYTFRVEERLKGSLGKTVDVESAVEGASCGIAVGVGDRAGILLYRRGGVWESHLCSQLGPAQLRAAAGPLPKPNGRGAAALVVGGSFGEARTIALDAHGHTLAYARGGGDTVELSVCPGRRRVAELFVRDAETPAGRASVSIAVRTLPRLTLVWTKPVPPRLLDLRRHQVRAFSCRDARGSEIFVFARRTTGAAPEAGTIFRVRDGKFAVLDTSLAERAAFFGDRAYLTEGARARKLVALDLRTRARRMVAEIPPGLGSLVLSRDGRFIAGYTLESSRVVLVRVGDGKVRTAAVRAPEVSGEVAWLSAQRLAYLPSRRTVPALLFDTSLRVRSNLPGWEASFAVARGASFYGIRWDGRVVVGTFPDGPIRVLRALPTTVVRAAG